MAAALNFPSGSSFRNTCQRYLSATPSQLRARGGAEYVIARLREDTSTTDDEDESSDAGDGGDGVADDDRDEAAVKDGAAHRGRASEDSEAPGGAAGDGTLAAD